MKHVFIIMSIGILAAQNINLQPYPEKTAYGMIQMNIPNIDGFELSSFSGMYELLIIQPISEKFSIESSISYSSFNLSGGSTDAITNLGNLYIGLHFGFSHNDKNFSYWSIGASLPTSDIELTFEGLALVGFNNATDLLSIEKYFPNMLTISGARQSQKEVSENIIVASKIGPKIYIPTGDNLSDTEIAIDLNFSMGIRLNTFLFGVEYQNLFLISAENVDFIDRFVSSLNLTLDADFSIFHPGVFYRNYLEELPNQIGNAYGIRFAIDLPN